MARENWEYKVIIFYEINEELELLKFGLEGWELVTVIQIAGSIGVKYYLKRRL